MPASPLLRRSSNKAAALIIVLAFVVLLTGLTLAYFSRTTTERQLAQPSYNDTSADLLARAALDIVVSNFQQEIVNGSISPAPSFSCSPSPCTAYYVYSPAAAAYMVPQRSGNAAGVPNLIRRSVRSDSIPAPGLSSLASAVNSTTDVSANGRSVTRARWNTHYLVPKLNTSDDSSDPIAAFTTPDWVFVTGQGPTVITAPNSSVVGRYAFAVYDEGGLLDMNVAGYPTCGSTGYPPADRSWVQPGRKGSLAFADLTALGSTDPFRLSNPDGAGLYQVDRLVGWRNYATTQPSNNFPDNNFAANFHGSPTPAAAYFISRISNTNGFMTVSSPAPTSTPTPTPLNNSTDQMFAQRQELVAFRQAIGSTTSFSANALQYLSTFSRETNAPSFSPPTPTPVNPNFLLIRVTGSFTRFDGTAAALGEPLVKTRFPLSRLAWITYKGPSANLATTDPVYTALINAGVSPTTIQAGTAANIKKCFGLVWDSRTYVAATATTNSQGQQWVYISPSTANTGGNFDPISNPTGNPASDIKTLATVASENREPDFFELLRAGILDASLGQSTSNGVTSGVTSSAADAQGANTFPDLHMSNKAFHVLSIGASIIDQADPDSVPTRIQLQPSGASVWWTAYGVESLPYITQIYPISGGTGTGTIWSTYLLFQLWNPHIGAALPTPAPQVRLRVDGNIGIFSDDGAAPAHTWNNSNNKTTIAIPTATPVTVTLTSGALGPGSTPAPLTTPGVVAATPSPSGTPGFQTLPAGTLSNYVGLRLPDFTQTTNGNNPPWLELYFGDTSGAGNHPNEGFNATMECTVDGGTTWIPYNYFIGITDRNSTIGLVSGSWMNGTTVPVRRGGNKNGKLNQGQTDTFVVARLTDVASPVPPDCLMKADPRATRFGIFQFKPPTTWTTTRITDPFWPTQTGNSALASGYGGAIADPTGPVEHAPLRFVGSNYFPATLCINNGAGTSTRTGYADADGVFRPADAVNVDPTVTNPGSSTPYSTPPPNDYHPIMLNRPFRNVGELGYAFRDLPWKTLDFFSDKSADAGLLDIFCIQDGLQSTTSYDPRLPTPTPTASPPQDFGNVVPTMVAGNVDLNTTQTADLQSVLARAIVDEVSSSAVSGTGAGAADAPALASQIVSAMAATPMQNKSELLTRSGLPTTILPVPGAGAVHPQRVKAMREVVARGVSSVSQTRVWNLVVDVVAQTGHYKANAMSLPNDFVVEGEQHYWVHVAIDRFTGQVIDRQVEVVKQ
jgi:hypothetical protein